MGRHSCSYDLWNGVPSPLNFPPLPSKHPLSCSLIKCLGPVSHPCSQPDWTNKPLSPGFSRRLWVLTLQVRSLLLLLGPAPPCLWGSHLPCSYCFLNSVVPGPSWANKCSWCPVSSQTNMFLAANKHVCLWQWNSSCPCSWSARRIHWTGLLPTVWGAQFRPPEQTNIGSRTAVAIATGIRVDLAAQTPVLPIHFHFVMASLWASPCAGGFGHWQLWDNS